MYGMIPPPKEGGSQMFDMDISIRKPRLANCAECGREVMANIQMLSDAPIVCSKCRCGVCRITLSVAVCRCGVAHGKPSGIKHVCQRCYELMEAGEFTERSFGIVTDAVFSFEQRLRDDLREANEKELCQNEENGLGEEPLMESVVGGHRSSLDQ